MKSFISESAAILKQTGKEWHRINPFRNAAVISYYAIFSLPGLFIIIVKLAGSFYGTEAIANQLSTQIATVIGANVADEIETIIANAHLSSNTVWATIVSIAVLVYSATGIFYHIQQSLDTIWQIRTNPDRRIKSYLKDRFFSFIMILVIGILLLGSVISSSIFNKLLGLKVAPGFIDVLLNIAAICISVTIITVLFAAIFKVLPDVKIRWRDVWPGACLTAVLFIIAKFLLGLFFYYTNPGSAYGTAGSIIIIMVWTNYSAIILLFGAVFTKVYTERLGSEVSVNSYAIFLDEDKR